MLTRQVCDKLGVPVRLGPSQFVIEVKERQNDPQLPAQFEQQPQQRNRINPAGNSDTHPIPRAQRFPAANLNKHSLRQWMHDNMVQLRLEVPTMATPARSHLKYIASPPFVLQRSCARLDSKPTQFTPMRTPADRQ